MSPIPGPIILLFLPLLAAAVAFVLRRWSFAAAAVSAVATGSLTTLCWRLPLDRTSFVLGQQVAFGRPIVIATRTLALEPAGQQWLTFVFALATLLYLIAWRMDAGRLFFPASLVALSSFSLIALLQNFPLSVVVFAMGAAIAVFMVQGERYGSVRAAQRYLVVTLLAVPLLLAAAWLAGQSAPGVGDATLGRLALWPAGLGFGLLLAAFPFGAWMASLVAEAPPMVSAFACTAAQAMAVLLALTFLRQVPWALSDATVLRLIQLAGLVMAAAGGLAAAVQRDFGRLFGYAIMSDLGILLLAVGLGGSQGIGLGLLHLINRSASIVLMAASLATLRRWATTDAFAGLTNAARRLPVATLGLMIGGLGLAGFPFTAGFPTHWAVGRAVAAEQWPWALVLLASSAGVIVGLVRGLSHMLATDSDNAGLRQPVIASLMLVALIGLVIALGLYPQLLLAPVQRAVQALSLF